MCYPSLIPICCLLGVPKAFFGVKALLTLLKTCFSKFSSKLRVRTDACFGMNRPQTAHFSKIVSSHLRTRRKTSHKDLRKIWEGGPSGLFLKVSLLLPNLNSFHGANRVKLTIQTRYSSLSSVLVSALRIQQSLVFIQGNLSWYLWSPLYIV